MSANRGDEITELLIEAERRRAWLVVHDKALGRAMRRRVLTGELIEPQPGCFARWITWSNMKVLPRYWYLLRAVATAYPECIFCHESAAVLHGLAVSYRDLSAVHVATSRRAHTRSSSLLRRHVIDGDLPVTIDGMRATSLNRTAFDCMRMRRFPQALAIADSALRTGRTDSEQLQAYMGALCHCPGCMSALRALSYADARAENGGESVARATMIELGFAIPDLQVPYTDRVTGQDYRVDFIWPLADKKPLAGELDGKVKYDDPDFMGGRDVADVVIDERHRESHLTIDVSAVCRFSLPEVYNRPYFARLLDTFGVPRVRL